MDEAAIFAAMNAIRPAAALGERLKWFMHPSEIGCFDYVCSVRSKFPDVEIVALKLIPPCK